MIKIRRTWNRSPIEQVVPSKKRKKRKNKKTEERYLIIDALEELNEEKRPDTGTTAGAGTTQEG